MMGGMMGMGIIGRVIGISVIVLLVGTLWKLAGKAVPPVAFWDSDSPGSVL